MDMVATNLSAQPRTTTPLSFDTSPAVYRLTTLPRLVSMKVIALAKSYTPTIALPSPCAVKSRGCAPLSGHAGREK